MKKYTIDNIKELFDKRDYDLLTEEYVNTRQQLEFTCRKHEEEGVQKIKADSFLYRNCGCHKCAKEKQAQRDRISEDYIKRICKEKDLIFIDVKYGKELSKTSSFVYFKCPKHEYVGIQKMSLNQLLTKKTNGCNYCNFVLDTYTFKEKLSKKGIDYFNVIGEYINQDTPIELQCKKHGSHYFQKPRKIFEGNNGCPNCKSEIYAPDIIPEDIIQERIHKKYPMIDIVGNYTNIYTPVGLYCRDHNYYFDLSVNNYLYKGKGCCCPKCIRSSGEEMVAKFLDDLSILYVEQKSFDDCKNKQSLLFDFYLPNNNICIEYNGKQHYEPIDYFGGDKQFEDQSRRDEIKRRYCKNKKISLIEIPY